MKRFTKHILERMEERDITVDEIDSTLANYAIGGVSKGTMPVGSFVSNQFCFID